MRLPDFPRRLEIELASGCNLRCVYCPRRYLKGLNGFMDIGLFKKIIDQASAYPETVIVLHRRGESFLHPKFTEILDYAAGKFKEIQLATNATLLDKDKFECIVNALDFISFSLDTPVSYNKTRVPAKYEDVERKILDFLTFNKGRVKTQASMVKTQQIPVSETESFKKIWSPRVDRVRIYEEHSLEGVFGAIRNPRKDRKPCVMPFYEFLIYEDGKVGRCNHDWSGEPMGDLNKNTITEVWMNEKFEVLRSEQSVLKINDPVCAKCDSWYPEIGKQDTGEVVENA
jgi:radical SAM protein with 4Fe4S-binding SPASM domain